MYNDSKCVFYTRKLSILGSIIEDGDIRPDPERLRPLQVLPLPKDRKSLRRILGFISYYSQWIHCYSEKIRPLATLSSFPISMEAKTAFETLKKDIEKSVVCTIDEHVSFEVETDASEFAIAATREDYTIYYRNLNTFVAVITFTPLSSVQILLLPTCCLLCVL